MKINIKDLFIKKEKVIIKCKNRKEQDILIKTLYKNGYKWGGDEDGSYFNHRANSDNVFIYFRNNKIITQSSSLWSSETYVLFSDIIFYNKFLIIKETTNEKC